LQRCELDSCVGKEHEENETMNGRRVIFVVDDEVMVRRSLHRALRHVLNGHGVDIHLFEHPLDALAKIKELSPDLIISDNSMPKMTGFDFLRKVRVRWPSIRTLMLTGGCIGYEIRDSVATGEIDILLEKPWLNEELCKNVREILGAN